MREKSNEDAPHRVEMSRIAGEPGDVPESAGLLLVRAWHEDRNQRFVARITTITDLVSGSEEVTLVSSTGDVEAAVRRWLHHLSTGETTRAE